MTPSAASTGSPSFSYRPDVDGLRALAVLPVLLFHAGLGCSGGFVGVDVFFVISGYVISSLILREIAAGSFSMVQFWERRIRRIFPALAVVPGDPEPGGIDPDARDRMIAALMQVCLPVRSVFVRPEMPIARLLALRPGDVIPISLPQHIPLTVAGRLFAHGTLGEADGRAAIRAWLG